MNPDVQENILEKKDLKLKDERLMKKFSTKPLRRFNNFLILGTLASVMAGIVTGYLLSGFSFRESNNTGEANLIDKIKVSEKEAGLEGESNFTDSAEGILLEGGIEGEGTHHLDRGMGPSKYVYLSSSVFDLQSFVGRNVKVWGETISALHAGWLMDVTKLKVID